MDALKALGCVLFAIAAFVALLVLAALAMNGLAWVSEHVIPYLFVATEIAFAVCVIILFPLALFRRSRAVSAIGFLACSAIFGLCAWVMGFQATLEYWGTAGVLIGLFLAVVGIVPLGIVASAFHGDWVAVGSLTTGLVMTFSARAIAYWLVAKVDRANEEKFYH
jgi:predicted neutral ceramidase superfamily lipid hydrolase